MKIFLATYFLTLFLLACEGSKLQNDCKKLAVLDSLKRTPAEGEWLFQRQEENLSLHEYISRKPLRTDSVRRYLYLIKIGTFDKVSNEIFFITKQYLQAYFWIDTKEIKSLNNSAIPIENQRANGQVDASYILDSLLYPLVPNDAHSIIAFTNLDLYPGNNWNYVFGLASYHKRVGVWSMARFIDSTCNNLNFEKALVRTLHVASHETGHMFGLPHCAMYECNMNGSNSLGELDLQISNLCLPCLQKLCWNRNIDAKKHVESMNKFYKRYLIKSPEARYYAAALAVLHDK